MPKLLDFPPSTYDDWRKEAEDSLKGAPFDKKLVSTTAEGILTQPIYNKTDIVGLPHLGGVPGVPPFLRGCTAAGALTRPPLIAQEIPAFLAKDFNSSLRSDIERGQTAVRLVPDKATREGLDPDLALESEVASGGVSLSCIEDIARALEGIDTEKTPVFFSAGSAALPLFALLIGALQRVGRDPRTLRGGIEFDPSATLARRGALPFELERVYRELAALNRWAASGAPGFRTLVADSTPWHDAGADAVQELAFALASGADTLRRLGKFGFETDQLASRVYFVMGVGSDFFMEIAKFRAARLLWHRILVAFGGSGEPGLPLHARTSRWNKTFLDSHTNMLRSTTEAFSAYVAGVEAVTVGGFDEIFRMPDEFSRRIARNTQIILGEECSLNRIIDPVGGAYYPEWLTDQVARKAWALFQEIEAQGGMMQAVLAGYPQSLTAKSADARQAALAQRRRNMVGVNIYANAAEGFLPDDTSPERAAHISEIRRKIRQKSSERRISAEHGEAIETLEKLSGLLGSMDEDLIETAVDAALHGATLGEITKTLRASSSSSISAIQIKPRRAADQFERIRLATEARRVRTGVRPKIFLACFGPLRQHKARADFSRSFLETGGFEVVAGKGVPAPEDAVRLAIEVNPEAVVICSTDETYPEIVPTFAREVKRRKPSIVVLLAGAPGENETAFREAGVDDFIHLRANCRDALVALQERITGSQF